MPSNDQLANALNDIRNAEKVSKKECTIWPVSKVILKVLELMQRKSYLGEIKLTKNNKGNALTIVLLGRINKCGVIKPRYSVKLMNYEKFEKRYLPAQDFGVLVVSTPKGIMTHLEAKEKKLGGRLLAYVY